MLKKKNQAPKISQAQENQVSDDLVYIEDLGHTANLGPRKKKKKKKFLRRLPGTCARLFVVLAACYLICVYSNNPFISKWRTIYIETAMTTMTHQWLATYFIPPDVVNEVVENIEAQKESQKDLEGNWDIVDQIGSNGTGTDEAGTEITGIDDASGNNDVSEVEEVIVKTEEELFYEKYWEVDTDEFREFLAEHPEYLEDGYENIDIEDLSKEYDLKTVNDDTVLALDAVNNVLLVELRSSEYVGKMGIIKNAAQVDLASCNQLGEYGDTIDQFGADNNAIIAVNASRFKDDGGEGNGGTVCGSLVIDGVDYGRPHKSDWKFFGMKFDNLFYITNYNNAEISDYRWALECYPALVVNGENVVDGTFGMGIQPRTTIGQTRNGDFILLTIDGRQAGYSIGASISECADIMIRYGCYQGADVDGGSSTVLWYKGQLITKSCSATGTGRLTPDAIIFRYANDPDVLKQEGYTDAEIEEMTGTTESDETETSGAVQ